MAKLYSWGCQFHPRLVKALQLPTHRGEVRGWLAQGLAIIVAFLLAVASCIFCNFLRLTKLGNLILVHVTEYLFQQSIKEEEMKILKTETTSFPEA